MTFGQIKSIIENQLIESYTDGKEFKKSLQGFKQDVLNNNTISKIYSLYDDLSTPQGLSEQDASEFLNEGISLLQTLITKIKIPKGPITEIKNNYQSIDELVYVTGKNIQLTDRLNNKKQIIKTLTQSKKEIKESVNIPLSSMVKIGNQKINEYLENMDESSKKELFDIIKEDTKSLKMKFQTLKEDASTKLNILIENEKDNEVKSKLTETISKIKSEKFDQMNYLKLKELVESL